MNRFATLLTSVVLVAGCVASARAQIGGANTGGATHLDQEERQAGNWRRVLMIGAHPDDEDTQLLTILARGFGIHTAYLSLTRGDGGQNLIGPELGEFLGVLRTEELASARAIDGGTQYFTRAFDFGFSKSAEESLAFWGRDSVLKDMVRIIRRFRPQVVISVWQGTPADGHGHHIASGILALEAFHAAGDSTRFPELAREQLQPWQPAKFYRSARGGGQATLTFDAGGIDPAVGMSYRQIAARSRSQHRSQNQGTLEELGDSRSGVRLVERAAGITGPDDSLFAGIAAEEVGQDVHSVEAALTRRGIVLDATTDAAEVTPGEAMPVTLRAWNTSHDSIYISVAMFAHVGFTSRGDACSAEAVVAPGALFSCRYAVNVWPNAEATTPYYLEQPRIGNLYNWSTTPPAWRGEPSAPPLEASFTVRRQRGSGPDDLHARREVVARTRDPVLGEVRHPVMIVPAITMDVEPNALLWTSTRRTHEFLVEMEHLAHDSTTANVSLDLPKGWTAGAPQSVHFTQQGEHATVHFTVTVPLHVKDGAYRVSARAITGTDTLATYIYRIRYPHIRDRNVSLAAQASVEVANVVFPAVGTIGYVRGGGDLVPEALINAGLSIAMLTGDSLERGSLARFHVIVIGPRAYEADPSLVRAHPRLMQWLNAGGTLIVQYQQTPYTQGGFAPKPLTIVQPTQSRVTDETAPVRFLAPMHPALRTPNLIGPADFTGWVQERGLDFPPQWDKAWVPLLEMHDSGGPPLSGGLLVAHVGRGTAVYTGLSFHRELPALVPGAWRLFANLLALGQRVAVPKQP
ncbi:MAG TPA: PIG-L family deacetylase [Gemmatimonadales bacterium]|jgi:LmbE family N-acetylglucosaminyl deacetylase